LITDWAFYAVAIPAILIVGISKGGFGAGLGIVGVPLIALAVSPVQAAAIMLPLLCVMDWAGMWAYRGVWDKANLKILLPAGVVGIVIGALSFSLLSDNWIRVLLGALSIGFVLNAWLRSNSGKPDSPRSQVQGSFWGVLSGYTSFVAHAGGPPLAVYLLPQRMEKSLFVGTTVVFFTIINAVKLIPYFWLGLFDARNLSTSLMLAPLAPIGIMLGVWLVKRVNPKVFYALCYTFLFITGCKLLYDGASRLI
jgi:uncharacterized membrane protein YfcA